jgi:hypothetical protein
MPLPRIQSALYPNQFSSSSPSAYSVHRQVSHGSSDLTFALTRSILRQAHGEHTARGRRSPHLSRRTEGLEVLVHHLFSLPLRPPHRSRVCELLFLASLVEIDVGIEKLGL